MPGDARTVVLFSVDGMRPDAVTGCNAPVMRRLMAEGACTLSARSVMPSVTLPCHTSMLRGVDVTRHGITTNTFMPLARSVPSLMDTARAAGKVIGSFYNWGELRDLAGPRAPDVDYGMRDSSSTESDMQIARAVERHLDEWTFDFLFVYFGWTDVAGHADGWMSRPYLDAVENADRCIGMVVEALKARGRDPVVLVMSDHGGHERSHGLDTPEDMTIPWILSGTGVKRGHRIQSQVMIYDTCPTLAALLGLPRAPEWDGRIIKEALV
jgi:predicted AlkP superfamily pyrophosphatase or phosphodiesterase